MDNPLKESVKKSKMIELQFEQKNVCIFRNNFKYL